MERRRLVAATVLAALVAAATSGCGSAQPTATPRASSSGGGQSTQVPGSIAGLAGTPGPNGGGGGRAPSYTASAAAASVTVAGKTYQFTGGTCRQDSTVYPLFELVVGTIDAEQYLDVLVTDMANPVHDGDYSNTLTLVTVGVEGDNHIVQGKVTLADGQTRGSFSGTASGNNPVEVSGTFTC